MKNQKKNAIVAGIISFLVVALLVCGVVIYKLSTAKNDEPKNPGLMDVNATGALSGGNVQVGNGDEWTILLYMCGSDLESNSGIASSVFDYIDNVNISGGVNVIVETGGSKEWLNKDPYFANDAVSKVNIPTDKLGRYKIETNNIVELGSVNLASMGSSDTLADFISWGVKSYPAKKYMLVLWDHGYVEPYGCHESEGIFYTDNNGNPVNSLTSNVDGMYSDYLDLVELRDALKKSNAHFEMITFNTCLSGSYEVASAVAPYANYMVASEESIPCAIGIPYEFLDYISKKPEANGDEVGKVILAYYKKYADNLTNNAKTQEALDMFSKATLSLTDLKSLEKFDSLMPEIWKALYESTYDQNAYAGLLKAALSCESYGAHGNKVGNLIDLKSFLTKAAPYLTNTTADEELIKLIDENVVGVMGNGRTSSNGMSFYMPTVTYVSDIRKAYIDAFNANGISYTDELLNKYSASQIVNNFGMYISNISAIKGFYWYAAYLEYRSEGLMALSPAIKNMLNENNSSFATSTQLLDDKAPVGYEIKYDNNGNITLNITSGKEKVVNVKSTVTNYTKGTASEIFLYLGSDFISSDSADSTVYNTSFAGEWVSLNNVKVHAFVIEKTEDFTTYATPVDINGKWAYIIFQKDSATGKYEMLHCYYADPTSGVATNEIFSLKKGDEIVPLFYSLTYIGEEGQTTLVHRQERKFTYDGTISIEPTKLFNSESTKDNVILYSFVITDSFGNQYQTYSLEFTFTKGELVKVQKAENYKDYSKIVDAVNGDF